MSTADASRVGKLPDFFIIGAMKSGTSSLRAYLDDHPEVHCAREQHFFNLHFERGTDWYAARLADAAGKRVLGEKCPEYLHNPLAAERMARVVPEARLIAILRDPVERAYSHYWHARRSSQETLPFTVALAAEAERVARGEESFAYVTRSLYLPQLEHVCGYFPRGSVHVILFEDLRDSVAATFKGVCRFLGVDEAFVPGSLGQVRNAYRSYRHQWLWRLLMNPRWRRLQDKTKWSIGRRMVREEPYPPMDDAVRRELEARFAADNEALAVWLGRDLAVWTSGPRDSTGEFRPAR